MTTEIAKKVNTIRDLLESSKAQFEKAVPKYLTADRMLRLAMTLVQNTPKLLECEPKSLLSAFMECAQLGLEPGGVLGQASLVPYKNKKKGISEAKFQIGYKGLLVLARRSGEITSFNAQVVYDKDFFDFEYGLNEKLIHRPLKNGDRGKKVAAHAVAKFKDGGYGFDVMFESDIEKIKKASKAYQADLKYNTKDSPWTTWPDEMWRKTVTKRLCKYLPQATELSRAAQLDESIDMDLKDVDISVSDTVQQKTIENTEELKNKLADKGKADPPTVKEQLVAYSSSLGQKRFFDSLVKEFNMSTIEEVEKMATPQKQTEILKHFEALSLA